ncbi:MAG TPA: glycoside hydrolase family 2 TIM barrel-domain containing protein, partial [Phototrophicaceae bacterium]|nr:glycoside hydrolase family 2 TIM barrel-domain containing protein [Phototrophicaceae bacterium]
MVLSASKSAVRVTLSLNDGWTFALDPNDIGIEDGWQTRSFESSVHTRGSWEEQGYGEPPSTHPLGGWSKYHNYEGAAWYSRIVEIPPDWKDKSIQLQLKGVRWRSEVWLDGAAAGTQESLSTPHIYELTPFAQAGSRHRLTIRIDNRMIYPLKESHINSEHTATRWGGITGGVELEALPRLRFEQIICRPNVAERRLDVICHTNDSADDLSLEVKVTDPQTGASFSHHGMVTGEQAISVELGSGARLWWDDDPFLYTAEFTLRQADVILGRVQQRVGLREISVEGRNILLNGQPIFLRGYVDCCIFPQTGYPSWDIEHYRRQFAIAKSYGFNHVRLHSWTAPEPFWQAADEAGMLVQTELPHWTRFYDHAESEPPPDVHRFLSGELERIVAALHFHPSWVMLSGGNELLGGADGHPRLTELVEHGKQLDPTRIYTDNTGFGQLPAPSRDVDYYIQSCNWHPPKKIYDAASADTTQDFSAITVLADAPVIGHEHGQFTMYVRPQEAAKYKGVIYPSWLDYATETLQAKGMIGRIDEFIQASGTHIVRTYKENIERARRTRDLAGFQLLDIRDFPGQGHATTGLLDVFWDSKGLVEPEVFAEFNSAVTLLMRAPSPTFWNGDRLAVDIDVSNFGHAAILAGSLKWELRSAEMTLSGQIATPDAPAGVLTKLGCLAIPLPAGDAAHAWELSVQFGGARNRWHLWSYPYPRLIDHAAEISTRLRGLRPVIHGANFSDDFLGIGIFSEGKLPPSKLAISERLTGRVLQYLYDGGSVWLMPGAKALHGSVPTRYLPPFWSYLWFPDNVSSV